MCTVRFSRKILLKVSDYVSKMVLKHFFLTVMQQIFTFRTLQRLLWWLWWAEVSGNKHTTGEAGLFIYLTARSNRGHVTEYLVSRLL